MVDICRLTRLRSDRETFQSEVGEEQESVEVSLIFLPSGKKGYVISAAKELITLLCVLEYLNMRY